MRMFLNELKEKTSLEFTYDFHKEIQKIPDILSIKPASIQIDVKVIEKEIILSLSVDVDMDLACAKTLKPVPFHMNIQEEVVIGDVTEHAHFIVTNEIDITDIIFGYIIIEKPYTIYHPDAKDILFQKEKSRHPAFADLDKLLKK